MKLVINRCFGGFGVSRQALRRLAVSDCPHVSRMEPKEYFGGDRFGSWREQFAKDQQRPEDGMFSRSLVIDGLIVIDEHRDAKARTCPHLVALVEEMGTKAASSDLGELKVVEVPDGLEYEIDEYDGVETIDEAHRSWS